MTTRMLIDARHPEETRVTVIRGNRVEEFDYESASKAQIKGNIYLAKVTRVEPSLQAAFVEYGGNRHGFLAFSEIHPDYYQIPIADREALLAEERAASARDAEDEEVEEKTTKGKKKSTRSTKAAKAVEKDGDAEKPDEKADPDAGPIADDEKDALGLKAPDDPDANGGDENGDNENGDNANGDGEDGDNAGEDEMAETIRMRRSMRSLKRRYKIQEVIKRRQILLVQVVKEERGTKGAALTTYLSLAGRYCVLMPNSTHGGGVSRKISNSADRRKLKTILSSLKGPQGIGCIIRTAGLQRTKAEIKRDYDYLLRLWEDIRALTLKSVAPALIYEEGNLIKRSIRDLYDSSIDEVLVEGEEAYKAAKTLMKLLMPSHAKKVQHYDEKVPLFHRYQVEEQLDSMFNPVVRLKSGGYLVINPTEALISIDVNSGRSTREHNIEETALKTNLEASDEVGRQLRLRDMAGLVVIDYIDMEYRGNNRKIERRLKDALKADRARIQVGRISQFGLLEMSRQRLRPNLVEASTVACRHCDGTGRSRTVESSALHALRALEEEGIRERSSRLSLSVPGEVALYILNAKRDSLHEMERKYGLEIVVQSDERLVPPHYEMTRTGTAPDGGEVSEVITDVVDTNGQPARRAENDRDASHKGRRGRRGRGREQRSEGPVAPAATDATDATDTTDATDAAPAQAAESVTRQDGDGEDKPRKRRRRGRRGGRRRRAAIAAGAETNTEQTQAAAAGPPEAAAQDGTASADTAATTSEDSAEQKAAPAQAIDAANDAADDTAKADGEKPSRRRRKPAAADETATKTVSETSAKASAKAGDKPKRARRAPAKTAVKKAEKTDAGTDEGEAKADKQAAKEAGEPAKKPARKTRAKSAVKEAKGAEKPEKTGKSDKAPKATGAGNGSPPEMVAPQPEPAKAGTKKSAPIAGASKEKTKRGWWQRSS